MKRNKEGKWVAFIRRTRAEKKQLILDTMVMHAYRKKRWTLNDVAKHTRYARSTKLKQLLDEMVDDGTLRIMGQKYNNGVAKERHVYLLPEYYTEFNHQFGRVF